MLGIRIQNRFFTLGARTQLPESSADASQRVCYLEPGIECHANNKLTDANTGSSIQRVSHLLYHTPAIQQVLYSAYAQESCYCELAIKMSTQ